MGCLKLTYEPEFCLSLAGEHNQTLTRAKNRTGVYKYKFNSKEWQDELSLNWYDYGARNYDPAIVRTTTYDPLAEKFYDLSPQSFLNNNPLSNIDPTGMQTEDWVKNNETGVYSWDANATDQSTTQKGHTYVGSSIADVNNDYKASHPFTSMFTNPTFGDTSSWPGEITQHNPGFWENQSKGNLAQRALYDTANGFYTTGQLFMFRNVGSGTMRNLDGSGTTTDQGVLGFASTAMFFMPAAKGVTTADGFLFKGFSLKTPIDIPVQRFGNMNFGKPDFWGLRIGTSTFANRTFNAMHPRFNNTLTQYSTGLIPKGTTIKFGVVGPQGLRYPGGSLQFIVPSRNVINQSSKIIPR